MMYIIANHRLTSKSNTMTPSQFPAEKLLDIAYQLGFVIAGWILSWRFPLYSTRHTLGCREAFSGAEFTDVYRRHRAHRPVPTATRPIPRATTTQRTRDFEAQTGGDATSTRALRDLQQR